MMIEEEAGTYTRPRNRTRTNNGYCAGDFKDVPFTWTKLYPPYVTMRRTPAVEPLSPGGPASYDLAVPVSFQIP